MERQEKRKGRKQKEGKLNETRRPKGEETRTEVNKGIELNHGSIGRKERKQKIREGRNERGKMKRRH